MTRREEPISLLSAGLTHLMMAAALVLAAIPFIFALPDAPAPPANVAAGAAPAAEPAAQAPVAAEKAEPAKDEWPKDEIARATEQCTHLLSGVAAEVEYLEPIKKGECGLPAPVRLKSLGSEQKVVFDPPVDVNCPMVAALNKWIKSTLKPNARERLKSEVVSIVNASGYSCRNVYGLPNAKLSQHALANAVDIGGFKLADGRTIKVLKGWGMTERDLVAQAKAKADAKAKAEAEAKATRAKGAVPAPKGDAATGDKQSLPLTKASLLLVPEKKDASASAAEPKPAADKAAAPAEPPKPTAEGLFLRAIHDGACRDFGTVLGPEANDPHRNHFHLDLIPRRRHGICE